MENDFKQMAALIGDPTRASILWALLDGRAFTATELAIAADTSPQNTSMHVNKLVQAQLLAVENQGRHRYYKFARKEVAYAIEAMASLLPHSSNPQLHDKADMLPVKYCRTCYDHLAGKIGVAITDSLLKQKIIVAKDNMFALSSKGSRWMQDLGIDTTGLQNQRRAFLRPCLDWSERRHHIAGSLGAALLNTMLNADWMRRTRNSRAIVITGKGQKKLQEYFNIDV